MFYSDFWYKLKEVSFESIFMPYIETQSLSTTVFIDQLFGNATWMTFFAGKIIKPDIVAFFEKANLHYPTIKVTTEINWDNV